MVIACIVCQQSQVTSTRLALLQLLLVSVALPGCCCCIWCCLWC